MQDYYMLLTTLSYRWIHNWMWNLYIISYIIISLIWFLIPREFAKSIINTIFIIHNIYNHIRGPVVVFYVRITWTPLTSENNDDDTIIIRSFHWLCVSDVTKLTLKLSLTFTNMFSQYYVKNYNLFSSDVAYE